MLVDAGCVVLRQTFLKSTASSRTASRMLRLRLTQPSSRCAEQAVEQLVRQHLRRQRAIVAGPAHIALDAFAERFLRHADLQRAESRLGADLGRDHLIDRRSAGAVSGERRAVSHAADRLVVAVAGTRYGCGRVVEAGQDVDVIAEGAQAATGTAAGRSRRRSCSESSSARECRCR